jgi:3-dehydroquinate synthase
VAARPTVLRARLDGASTTIHIADGSLDRVGALVRAAGIAPGPVALVSDARVHRLYGARVRRSLARAGLRAGPSLVVPAGERSKSLSHAARLYDGLAKQGLERGRPVIALGGGVVGDLAGFAAATWLRGVPLVLVPTSLLAQLDASVGGKTAVDLPAGKNLVGAFHHPRLVVTDPQVLVTLPRRHLRAGLAEAAKVGFALDAALVRALERDARSLRAGGRAALPALRAAVVRAVRAKLRVVARDPREGGARALLNYGHTTGHALETIGGYRRWLHGEAVAMGMLVAARAAVRRGLLAPAVEARQARLLAGLGLPRRLPRVSARKILSAMRLDKKRSAGNLRFVLTRGVGVASFGEPLTRSEVLAALQDAGASR